MDRFDPSQVLFKGLRSNVLKKKTFITFPTKLANVKQSPIFSKLLAISKKMFQIKVNQVFIKGDVVNFLVKNVYKGQICFFFQIKSYIFNC